jgi:prophage regulatory protein
MTRKILRLPQVKEATGLSKSAIYSAIGAGRFPASVPITSRIVGWLSDEIDAWLAARVEERGVGSQAARARLLARRARQQRDQQQQRRAA